MIKVNATVTSNMAILLDHAIDIYNNASVRMHTDY